MKWKGSHTHEYYAEFLERLQKAKTASSAADLKAAVPAMSVAKAANAADPEVRKISEAERKRISRVLCERSTTENEIEALTSYFKDVNATYRVGTKTIMWSSERMLRNGQS